MRHVGEIDGGDDSPATDEPVDMSVEAVDADDVAGIVDPEFKQGFAAALLDCPVGASSRYQSITAARVRLSLQPSAAVAQGSVPIWAYPPATAS